MNAALDRWGDGATRITGADGAVPDADVAVSAGGLPCAMGLLDGSCTRDTPGGAARSSVVYFFCNIALPNRMSWTSGMVAGQVYAQHPHSMQAAMW